MITEKDVWKEIVPYKDIEKSESNKFISNATYKILIMGIRLLLQIRRNQNQLVIKSGFKLIDERLNKEPKEK